MYFLKYYFILFMLNMNAAAVRKYSKGSNIVCHQIKSKAVCREESSVKFRPIQILHRRKHLDYVTVKEGIIFTF